jgi:uncharacterized membrane protein
MLQASKKEEPMPTPVAASPRGRLASIDIVRGLIMIFMALDHTRYFFSNATVGSENFLEAGPWLFFARWITHFCAPGFFFIAGIGVSLYEAGKGAKRPAVEFLLSRGLWLVAIELTIVGFAWSFSPGWSMAGVIWALGWSLVLLAGLIFLPRAILAALALSFLIVQDGLAAHYGLIPFPTGGAWLAFLWTGGVATFPLLGETFVLYAVLPWLSLMAVGYCIGGWFLKSAAAQRTILVRSGLALIGAFLVLRVFNLYGTQDPLWLIGLPGTFAVQASALDTVMSLLNTNKYQDSLQFALMTIGPTLVVLGLLAGVDLSAKGLKARVLGIADLYGRVPFFYYVLHLFVIHLLASAYTLAGGFEPAHLFWDGVFGFPAHPEGYGFGIGGVALAWALVVAILYWPCRWFMGVKARYRWWWLKYL